MSCGIYKIENMITGEVYIGQSTNIAQRFNHHKNYSNRISHYPLYQAFQTYGIENFNFSIIEECNLEQLNEKEIYYINKFDSFKNGYNQTTGGSGTADRYVKLSLEDIEIIYDLLQFSDLSQNDIAKLFNVGRDTISEINNGKTRRKVNIQYPLRKNRNDLKYCAKCGKQILFVSTYCPQCEKENRRIVERPTREALKDMIRNIPFTQIAKQFGVTDKAIVKWCISMGLPSKKKDINSYSDEEWNKI